VQAAVRDVLTREVDEYRVVKTGTITVHVTPEHPFYVGNGTFKTLQALKVATPSSSLTAATQCPADREHREH